MQYVFSSKDGSDFLRKCATQHNVNSNNNNNKEVQQMFACNNASIFINLMSQKNNSNGEPQHKQFGLNQRNVGFIKDLYLLAGGRISLCGVNAACLCRFVWVCVCVCVSVCVIAYRLIIAGLI